ncbi:MAG TPA: hypothetical protein VMF91_07410 [Bryobacteraceae bacterium]|nr:hypothetical protein [Bryobacteraceae bacterium]
MDNLRRLGNQFSISIKPDEDGYLGRECPVEACLGYFKITPGTGVKGPAPCHCPYCGHSGENNTFTTQEQIEYAKSVVIRQVTDAIHKDLKSMEFDHRPRGGFGIGVSMKVTRGAPHPVRYYREKELETEVVCDSCTLRYAIYGVFGWCPDCGIHNSIQILKKNLELANKELTLAESVDRELADHLIGDALENVVSAFDGFGREICLQKGADIRFQNLPAARRKVRETFGFDLGDGLEGDQWEHACRIFQKRHVLAHKMGVMDDEYVQKANDPGAIAGRKITISREEVVAGIAIVEALGRQLFERVLPPPPQLAIPNRR